MSNTYTWQVDAMDCTPQAITGTTDVVYNVHWRVNATDGATPPHNASVYGTQTLQPPSGTPIPYAQLTPATVLGWVQAEMGAARVTEIEAALDAQIAAQVAPKTVSPALPW